MLFRLDIAAPFRPPEPQLLANELRRHLLDAALHSYLLQSGTRRQAYLSLATCPGCRAGRCRPDCRVDLLRRWLPAALGNPVQLRPVHTFCRRPYRHVLLLQAGPTAASLTQSLLAAWPEARLSLAWQPYTPGGFPLRALLHTGTGSSAGVEQLLAHGWHSESVELTAQLEQQPATQWAADPFLLLPTLPDEETVANNQADPAVLQQRRACLSAILSGTFAVQQAAIAEPVVPADATGAWPPGPGNGGNAMHAADVAALVHMLCTDAECVATGLKRRRLLPLLAERHKEHAAAICCWLEQAGVLAEPADPAQAWAQPRPLAIHDPAGIAQRLRSTPLPDQATLTAARAGGL